MSYLQLMQNNFHCIYFVSKIISMVIIVNNKSTWVLEEMVYGQWRCAFIRHTNTQAFDCFLSSQLKAKHFISIANSFFFPRLPVCQLDVVVGEVARPTTRVKWNFKLILALTSTKSIEIDMNTNGTGKMRNEHREINGNCEWENFAVIGVEMPARRKLKKKSKLVTFECKWISR